MAVRMLLQGLVSTACLVQVAAQAEASTASFFTEGYPNTHLADCHPKGQYAYVSLEKAMTAALRNPEASGVTGYYQEFTLRCGKLLQRAPSSETSWLKRSLGDLQYDMPDQDFLYEALVGLGAPKAELVGPPCLWPGVTCTFNENTNSAEVSGVSLNGRELATLWNPGFLLESWCYLRGLRNFDLESMPNVKGEISALANCTQLQSLNMYNMQVAGDIGALSALTELEYLRLTSIAIGGDIKGLITINKLTSVFLDSSRVYGDIGSLSNKPGLKYLNIPSTDVGGDLCGLSNLPSLSAIIAGSSKVSGNLSCLATFPKLKNVELSKTQVYGGITVFSSLPRILWLNLQGTMASGDICSLPASIITLRVDHTEIFGDAGCLAEMQLTEATFGGTDVSGSIRVFAGMSDLKELNVSGTQISGDFADLDFLRSLKVVDLGHSRAHLSLGAALGGGFKALETLQAPNITVFLTAVDVSFMAYNAIFPALITLNLRGSRMDSPIERLMVTVLGRCARLSTLDVSWTDLRGSLSFVSETHMYSNGAVLPKYVGWAGSLTFLNLRGTLVTSVFMTDDICRRRAKCPRAALKYVDLSDTPNLKSIDGSLLAADSAVLVDLRGSGFGIRSIVDASQVGLQRSDRIDISRPVEGFQCFGLEGRPLLMVDPATFAPELLCQCLPGFSGTAATCVNCSEGLYQPDFNKSECMVCSDRLEQPNPTRTGCEPGLLGRMVNVYSAAAAFCTAAAAFLLYRGLMGVPIDDVSMDGHMLVASVHVRHGVLRRFARAGLFTVRGSGHPALDGRTFRVAVLSSHRLQLIGFNGPVEASMGWIRPVWTLGLVAQGVLGAPTGLVVPGLLVALRWLVRDPSGLLGFRWVPLMVGVLPVVLLMARELLLPVSTRLEARLLTFGRALRQSPRYCQPCARGRSRGVTIRQLLEFQGHFRDLIGERDMYYVVSQLIRRLTRRHKLSYAELAGPCEALWFVSHFWGTGFRHFVESLRGHAEGSGGTLWQETSYWICSFSNNQWSVEEEVGKSWEQSSFYLTLRSGVRGTVMVLDEEALPLTRVWCLFELLQTFILEQEQHQAAESDEEHQRQRQDPEQQQRLQNEEEQQQQQQQQQQDEEQQQQQEQQKDRFQGLLLATPSGVLNYGAASADMAVGLAQRLAKLKLQEAHASMEKDRQMIFDLISKQPGGFAAINAFVRERMQAALRKVHATFERRVSGLLDSLNAQPEANPTSPGGRSGVSSRSGRLLGMVGAVSPKKLRLLVPGMPLRVGCAVVECGAGDPQPPTPCSPKSSSTSQAMPTELVSASDSGLMSAQGTGIFDRLSFVFRAGLQRLTMSQTGHEPERPDVV